MYSLLFFLQFILMSKSKKRLLGIFLFVEFAVIVLAPFLELYALRKLENQQESVKVTFSNTENVSSWHHSNSIAFLVEIKDGTEEEQLSESLSFWSIKNVEAFVASEAIRYLSEELGWEFYTIQIPLYLKFCTLKIPF